MERIAALMRGRPGLVILDNFESALGETALLPAAETAAVLDAAHRWATAGQGRVLITTRDTTFPDERFRPSAGCRHLALGGLSGAEALALAGAVLDDRGIDRGRVGREPLLALLDRLGGHPLSLVLVLPQLAHVTVAQLTAEFEALLPGFTTGAARERNESLAVSLEFSLRRLGEATRAALPDLAVFQGGCMEYDLLNITGMAPELWAAARPELQAAALVTVEPVEGVNVPFLRFHPTLLPYLARALPPERRAALEDKFWREYYATAKDLYQLDTPHPHEARAIARRELPNLRRGIELALAAVEFADRVARFLYIFGRGRERAALLERVAAAGGSDGEAGGDAGAPLTKAQVLALTGRGETLLAAGRAGEAAALFRGLLARLEAVGDPSNYSGNPIALAYDTAVTMVWFGRCLAAGGQPGEAIGWHERARDGFAALSETSANAKEMLGMVHSALGDVLGLTGRFAEAREAYDRALALARETEGGRAAGVTLGNMGTLALIQHDLQEAEKRYWEALDTFRALGEPAMEAVAWHQLGLVAQEARQWEAADERYRESLRLKEGPGDLPGVAGTCNQLAIVAKRAGRPADAERWYLRAADAYERLNRPHEQAKVLSNLANLYLSLGRLDEAEAYARRAADIKATLDASAEPWTTFNILAGIAAGRGRTEEAAGWRRQEQDSFAAYAGSSLEVDQWRDVIAVIVAACEGQAEAAPIALQIVAHYRDNESWGKLADAFTRILDGERDLERLRPELDRTDFVIVRAVLARLDLTGGGGGDVAAPDTAPPPPVRSEEAEDISAEELIDQLIEAAIAARAPDAPAGLKEQVWQVATTLAFDPDAPPELKALGRALAQYVAGDAVDAAGLPAAWGRKLGIRN